MSKALSIYHGPFGRASLYDLDRPMTMHAHREGHLTFHIGGVPGTITVNGKAFPCDRQNGIAINPWEPHAFRQNVPGSNGVYLVLYINPNWYMRTVGQQDSAGLFFRSPHVPQSPAIASLIDHLLRMMAKHRATPDFEQTLVDLGHESALASCGSAGSAARSGPHAARGIDFRVRKSIDLLGSLSTRGLHQEPDRDRMGMVARAAGLSRAHFFKLFRDNTGITPNLYMNTIQVERALIQVAETTDPVNAISEDLGFSCQSTFTRFFSAHVGMAPTEYRSVVRVVGQAGSM